MAGKKHHFWKSLNFPQDEFGRQAAVLFGLTGFDPGKEGDPGEFVPVDLDYDSGQLKVQIHKGAAYAHADGNIEPGLIDALRRAQVVGHVSTPTFLMMHDDITAANVETTVPAAPKGIEATGANLLLVDIDIATPGGFVTLQPIIWNPLFEKYVRGEASQRITESIRLELPVHSPEDLYLMPIEVSGTVSVAVAPVWGA